MGMVLFVNLSVLTDRHLFLYEFHLNIIGNIEQIDVRVGLFINKIICCESSKGRTQKQVDCVACERKREKDHY